MTRQRARTAFLVVAFLGCAVDSRGQTFGARALGNNNYMLGGGMYGGGVRGGLHGGGVYTAEFAGQNLQGPLSGRATVDTRAPISVGPDGRTYSSISRRGFAGSPWGATNVGDLRTGYSSQPYRRVEGAASAWGAVGTGLPTDLGAHRQPARTYSSVGTTALMRVPLGLGKPVASGFGLASNASRFPSAPQPTGAPMPRIPTDFDLGRLNTTGTSTTHSTSFWTGGQVAQRADQVREAAPQESSFTRKWLAAHPQAWKPGGWAAGSSSAWTQPDWRTLSGWFGTQAEPVRLDYGATVVIHDNVVYFNGADAGPAERYAQQAIDIADRGRQAASDEGGAWQPLGVFSVVQGDDRSSTDLLQLAVNQAGVVRGNFYQHVLGANDTVYGQVDLKSQRVVWTIGEGRGVIFEAGLDNLTKDQLSILVHFGKERTQQWLLVRLKSPPENLGD